MKNEFEIYGKLPPQATEAEAAVLGALMLEKDSFDSVSGIIGEQSFYKDSHATIYRVIADLKKSNKPVDIITVTSELKNLGLFDEITPAYITGLTRSIVSAAHIESHARIIAEKFYQRETIKKASELITKAYSGEDVEVLTNDWRQSGQSLEDIFTATDTGTNIKEVLKKTISEIERDAANVRNNSAPGIPTGFQSLDVNTGGWRNGDLNILAARPGVGKTSFALHFALQSAKAGKWVNIFSLEMNKEDLARIILSAESGVYRSNVRDGYLQNEDWKKLNSATASLQQLPIIFKDSAGLTINQIQAAVRKNRKNGKCDFAVVDYLQLVKSSLPKAIREQEVSEISRTLKTVALAENIPILALSQLNRTADGETPKLSHLRESGAIEQDADLVLFLHRPNDNDNTIVRLTIAKHRRGRMGEIDIAANSEMTNFWEIQEATKAKHPDSYLEPVNKDEPF